jgi:hypothetical protein
MRIYNKVKRKKSHKLYKKNFPKIHHFISFEILEWHARG